jgi:hypothetical protein
MSFKINSQKSILDNIICYEKVNKITILKLINSSLLKEDFRNPFCSKKFKNEADQLIKYKNLINNDGYAVVNYNKVKDMGDFGRVFPRSSLGLYSIRRQIRHTLAKEYYIDIDIKNCHPEILLQLCNKNGLEPKYLKTYVRKRDKMLKKVEELYLNHIEDKNERRDKVKQLFIRLLYFGNFENWLKDEKLEKIDDSDDRDIHDVHTFIYKFKDELDNIGKRIIKDNPHIEKLVEDKKKKRDGELEFNKKGSVVSYYLQEYENRILECIYKYMVTKNIINPIKPDCVLCADGIMIPKDKYYDNLLNEIQNEIKNQFDLDLTLTDKDMDQDYLNILDTKIINDNLYKYYEFVKDKFETTKFKVMNPIMFAEISNGDKNLILRKKEQFKTAFENTKYIDVSVDKDGNQVEKELPFINSWFMDENNKTYDRIDFLPKQQAPERVYNSFSGYEVENLIKKEEIDIKETKVYKHLNNLCNNNSDVFNYVIKFLARKLKKPYKLTNTALIFRSKEGCGKDSFFNWFGNKILGRQYYLNEDKTELIFGRFNDSIENKIIVVINETSGQDTFKLINTIKNAITRIINKIEYKGMTPYDNTNNIGFIFLTNHKNSLKIDLEDRRFVAIECNNDIANNKIYFDELYKEFENDDVAIAFYNYLMSIECDNFDFTGLRPETEFYKNMQEANIPIVAKFFEEEIYENRKSVKTYNDLFGDYMMFLQRGNFKYEITSSKFGLELKEYDGINKIKTMKGVNYIVDFEKLKSFLISKKYMSNEFLD